MAKNVYDYYYENYLMLYSLYGRGRPRVSRHRYEELDIELLEHIASVSKGKKQKEQVTKVKRGIYNRICDIEYLLLDDIAQALLDNDPNDPKATSEGDAYVLDKPDHSTSP